jgi:hypothetical protein
MLQMTAVTKIESTPLSRAKTMNEYPAVVPIMMQHYMMLQRNLLYTSVTRGKRLVILLGQKKGVAIAVKNVSGGQRWSKLREWLSHPIASACLSNYNTELLEKSLFSTASSCSRRLNDAWADWIAKIRALNSLQRRAYCIEVEEVPQHDLSPELPQLL